MAQGSAVYGGRDPRDLPIYTAAQAARYLGMPPATLRAWVAGRSYPRADGPAFSAPLIRLPVASDLRLSFTNLVEAHVLLAIRKVHGVPMAKVRVALDYAQQKLGIERLLVRNDLLAAPGNLFLRKFRQIVNLSESGQLAMARILADHLRRIDHDLEGLPERLYPFVPGFNGDRVILIDPRISFGRPVIARRGVTTSILVERLDSGESLREIALDYDLEEREVEEAILYERAA